MDDLQLRADRQEGVSTTIDREVPVSRGTHPAPARFPDVSALLADVLVLATRLQHVSQSLAGPAMRGADVTVPQWLVLRHLRDTGGCTLTTLAAAIDHDRGGLSRTLYKLRQRQLITPRARRDDRRAVWLELAPAGLALCNALEEAMRRQLASVFEQVQPQNPLRQLTRTMLHAAATLRDAAALSEGRARCPAPAAAGNRRHHEERGHPRPRIPAAGRSA
ncbi:MarR family winged helix-turn-helix transcriptional regulator [Cupriavidus oxalaticus]|uniref:MarR family winged helix-turn-helix transcriptional regulator n=1 Tax=Cupriavidus oxalaticus TaxID=96344 RepID=UPI0031738B9E